MATATLGMSSLCKHVSDNIKDIMKQRVKAELQKHADTVIEDAAEQLCKDLIANMESYYEPMFGEAKFILRLDGVNKEIS